VYSRGRYGSRQDVSSDCRRLARAVERRLAQRFAAKEILMNMQGPDRFRAWVSWIGRAQDIPVSCGRAQLVRLVCHEL
jgi:hypothetical protein